MMVPCGTVLIALLMGTFIIPYLYRRNHMLDLDELRLSSMKESCSVVVGSVSTHWSRYDFFRRRILPFIEALRGIDFVYIHLQIEHWNLSETWTQNLSSKTFVFPYVEEKTSAFMSTLNLVSDMQACIMSMSEYTLYRDMNTVLHLRNISNMFPDTAVGMGCEQSTLSWSITKLLSSFCPFCPSFMYKGTNVNHHPWYFFHNPIEMCSGWLTSWLGALYKRKHFHASDTAEYFARDHHDACYGCDDLLISGYLRRYKVPRIVFTRQRVRPVFFDEISDLNTGTKRFDCADEVNLV